MSAAAELSVGAWVSEQVGEIDGLNGCWLGVIPNSAQLPAARFQAMARHDVMVIDGRIIMTHLDFLVVATVEGSPADVAPFAVAIHEALHDQVGANDGAVVTSCLRIEPFVGTDVIEGRVYRHAGGIYRVTAEAP